MNKRLMDKRKEPQRIQLSGNNDGDYLILKAVDERRVYIELGHCCVVTLRHIIPVEFITGALSEWIRRSGKAYNQEHMGDAVRAIGWAEPFTTELIGLVEPVKYEGDWKETL